MERELPQGASFRSVNLLFKVHHKLPAEQLNPELLWTFLNLKTFKRGSKGEGGLTAQGEEERVKERAPHPFWWPTFSRASGNLMQIQTSPQMRRIIAH